MKFSPEEGTITIRARKTGNLCSFLVTDQGPGMDLHTQEKIFDRFYQGDRSHSMEGNGLGLPLVKKIVALHRGAARVDSRPGQGSTFTVSL